MVFLAELMNIALKVKALFYLLETILNSYENKYTISIQSFISNSFLAVVTRDVALLHA
jgi:hypothetical protein